MWSELNNTRAPLFPSVSAVGDPLLSRPLQKHTHQVKHEIILWKHQLTKVHSVYAAGNQLHVFFPLFVHAVRSRHTPVWILIAVRSSCHILTCLSEKDGRKIQYIKFRWLFKQVGLTWYSKSITLTHTHKTNTLWAFLTTWIPAESRLCQRDVYRRVYLSPFSPAVTVHLDRDLPKPSQDETHTPACAHTQTHLQHVSMISFILKHTCSAHLFGLWLSYDCFYA